MSQLKNLRIEASLTVSEFARVAEVSRSSVEKAERDEPIRADVAGKICRALSDVLGRHITHQDAGIIVK